MLSDYIHRGVSLGQVLLHIDPDDDCKVDDEDIADKDQSVGQGDRPRVLLLLAGDVVSFAALFGLILENEAKQNCLSKQQPETDQHANQNDDEVDVARIARQ